jgi:uncharacterized protein YndB with AHSA1/START domain
VDHDHHEEGDVAVERSVELAADRAVVWDHVTNGDMLSRWMDGDVSIDPRVGGSITMRRPGDSDVWGVVEHVDPGRGLQWCWRTDDGLPTMVEITLEPAEDGMRLTVRETLLPWRSTTFEPRWLSGEVSLRRRGLSLAA